MKIVIEKKALEKLTEMLEQGRKDLSCEKCNQDNMTVIKNYSNLQGTGMTLVDFSIVCNKCKDITNYELIKTYDKY